MTKVWPHFTFFLHCSPRCPNLETKPESGGLATRESFSFPASVSSEPCVLSSLQGSQDPAQLARAPDLSQLRRSPVPLRTRRSFRREPAGKAIVSAHRFLLCALNLRGFRGQRLSNPMHRQLTLWNQMRSHTPFSIDAYASQIKMLRHKHSVINCVAAARNRSPQWNQMRTRQDPSFREKEKNDKQLLLRKSHPALLLPSNPSVI